MALQILSNAPCVPETEIRFAAWCTDPTRPMEGPKMSVLDHNSDDHEYWRDGVRTQMRTSALTSAHQLCIFEQWCDHGLGAPLHEHAVEEVLEVIEGTAEIWLDDETHHVTANQSVLIPRGAKHGFRNIGEGTLHVRATLAAAVFEASYDDRAELSRRYSPQG